MKIIIAVPDFTREAHLKKILPGLLNKLAGEGVRYKDIEILIGTGLHRQPTKKEIGYNLGSIADKVKISSHNYKNRRTCFQAPRQWKYPRPRTNPGNRKSRA